VHRRSERNIIEGSKYAHWIGLYLSFLLNWVLGPFVHVRLQNLQTSEVTFAHVITPLTQPEPRLQATPNRCPTHTRKPGHPTTLSRIKYFESHFELLLLGSALGFQAISLVGVQRGGTALFHLLVVFWLKSY